jgi:hypothetical protein
LQVVVIKESDLKKFKKVHSSKQLKKESVSLFEKGEVI